MAPRASLADGGTGKTQVSSKPRQHRCVSWECVKREMDGYDLFSLLEEVVNPFSGWYLCEYYLGTEHEHWLGNDAFALLKRRRLLQELPKCDKVKKEMAIIFVEATRIEEFATDCLPALRVPVIIISGRWHIPSVQQSRATTAILSSNFIYKWFLQNPFTTHEKIIQFPYGVMHSNLPSFAHIASRPDLLKSNRTKLMNLPLGRTNKSREQLTGSTHKRLSVGDFYDKLTQVEFVISPAGDRPDCHRHLEAIGLGARPICNCPEHFRDLYGNLMVIGNMDFLRSVLETPAILNSLALKPIRVSEQDLLSTGFWAKRIQLEISKYRATGQ